MPAHVNACSWKLSPHQECLTPLLTSIHLLAPAWLQAMAQTHVLTSMASARMRPPSSPRPLLLSSSSLSVVLHFSALTRD